MDVASPKLSQSRYNLKDAKQKLWTLRQKLCQPYIIEAFSMPSNLSTPE